MKQVIDSGNYDIIWTNEPVMGVATRLAARKARKNGTKVIYMVHGFHFYKGAPLLNWLIFYPVESFTSRFCDEIVTINKEDYSRAQKLHAPLVRYIHGIGINTERLTPSEQRNNIREELNLPETSFIVLSVGELNENKNQKTIIKAVAELNDPDIHYILCGKGDQLDNLKNLAEKLNIADHVHFLGYRKDVVDICSQADVFAMPSHREGLPVASLEAMYCGLPLVTSNIRGLVDVMQGEEREFLCNPDDVNMFAQKIKVLENNAEIRSIITDANKKNVFPFCISNVKSEVINLFFKCRIL